jgi:hypothetical protein
MSIQEHGLLRSQNALYEWLDECSHFCVAQFWAVQKKGLHPHYSLTTLSRGGTRYEHGMDQSRLAVGQPP